MKLCNFAIMGPGRIAEKFAGVFTLGLVPGARLLGAASNSDPEKARVFAAAHHLERVYKNYPELLADPEVDIVYISTTNEKHYECCRQCIAAGKHMLCEKPLTPTAAEARDLEARAKAAGVFLMEGLWTRFLPGIQKASEWIEKGRIGEVCAMSLSICSNRDPKEFVRLYDKAMYGGALRDFGVYGLHMIRHFLKGKSLVKNAVSVVPSETGVDLSTFISLEYEGGSHASLQCSIGFEAQNNAFIYGSKGYIRIGPWFIAAMKAELFTEPFIKSNAPEDQKPSEIFIAPLSPGFEHEILHAALCVGSGWTGSPVVTMEDTIAVIEFTEKVLRE
ncbi:Gfo/Idh/MocA family oxidoreductase [Treponema sp. TIM-1]|uniref:Gfo/Idh/MocA family protein n=1 Tax=Treponema sp. TIM-1 TaxID=2898417 RepID=UPI00397F565A